MRALIAAVLTAAVALPGWAAPAAKGKASTSKSEAEGYSARAVERFKAKDFEAAAKLFMQAYAKSHAPALVFNAARAYQEAGKAGDAASLFKLYITISEDADGIVDARERLKALAGATVKVAPDPAAASKADGTVPAAVDVGVKVADHNAPPVSAPNTALKWGVAGGAVAAVAGGVALMLIGRANSNTANELVVGDEAGMRAYNDQYNLAQSQWGGGLGLVAAGALLAGWATWLHASERRPSPVQVGVSAGVRGVHVAVKF